MKKLLLIVLILAGCKKESVNVTYAPGTYFNLKNISLTSLAQMHNGVNVVPENPFIIEDLWPNSLEPDIKYYTCHSANGNSYKMPETDMQIIPTPPVAQRVTITNQGNYADGQQTGGSVVSAGTN